MKNFLASCSTPGILAAVGPGPWRSNAEAAFQMKASNMNVSQMFVGQSTFYVLEGHFAQVHKGAGGLGGNYGFSDGHVEFHKPSDYKDNNGVIFTSAADSNGDPRDPWKWLTRN